MNIEAHEVGFWSLDATVEVQPQARYSADEPPVEKGDLLFRVKLTLDYNDDSGENGVAGELATPWLWSLDEAVKQTKLLRVISLTWYEYDDAKDDYVLREGSADFDAVVARAVTRFQTALPGVG